MKQNDHRIEEIFRAIQDIASGKFSTHIDISETMDEIDGIATGINMLAEEVQFRIEKQAEENVKLTRTIIQLKELKLALSKSEELFWQIFQTSPDGISISRISDGVFMEVNKGFEKMTGYNRKELIGYSIFDFGIWTRMADRDRMAKQLKQKGFYSNLESDFKVRSGLIRRGLVSASLMEIGGEPHMVTISRDITEIREAERDLQSTQRKYQELIQLAPDGIILFDAKGNIEMANSSFLRITGLKAKEAKGLHFQDFAGFDNKEKVEYGRLFRQLIKGGKATPLEIKFKARSGEVKYVELLSKALKHEGRVTGLQVVMRDITERILAMETIKASEIQYRTSMDAMHSYIFLMDRDLNILLANKSLKASLKNLGLPTDVIGKNYQEALPFLGPSIFDGYQRMLKHGKPVQKEESYSIEEHEFFMDNRIIPIIEDKKVIRILTIVQDISERKRAERVQQILYNISNAVNLTRNLNDLFLTIQNELGEIFDTRNFFIALYNKEDDTLSLPFFVDEKDAFDAFPAKQTLTGYMIRNDRPILMKDVDIEKLIKIRRD